MGWVIEKDGYFLDIKDGVAVLQIGLVRVRRTGLATQGVISSARYGN